jgi:hypothetical protein
MKNVSHIFKYKGGETRKYLVQTVPENNPKIFAILLQIVQVRRQMNTNIHTGK